ncbi:cupin domain-containing protein [Hymenobacter artigasi]|uniref:Quercetin dioxygenase-like cupin family protein n=1 Tax=Hymenobacter artigasi TaxID=2719616 RepID=A0ABX1HM19_9BACT|nr:cupin domain-containing protein [Hymenobacter artigasi]NKI90929.1 quercetin dioxygenase-like cupin family protein [Hymenobacter artigasi]
MHPPLKCGSLLDGAHTAIGPQKGLVLLKKDSQNIIFKTLEAGENMPTHHHDGGDVLVVVLVGELTITQEETSVEVQAGDYVIFPAGAPHSLACRQAARIVIYR